MASRHPPVACPHECLEARPTPTIVRRPSRLGPAAPGVQVLTRELRRGQQPSAATPRAERGTRRRRTSRRWAQRQFSFTDCVSGELQGRAHIVAGELRKVPDDPLRAHPLCDHRHDRRHGETGPTDARHPAHNIVIDGDSLVAHEVTLRDRTDTACAIGRDRTSTPNDVDELDRGRSERHLGGATTAGRPPPGIARACSSQCSRMIV